MLLYLSVCSPPLEEALRERCLSLTCPNQRMVLGLVCALNDPKLWISFFPLFSLKKNIGEGCWSCVVGVERDSGCDSLLANLLTSASSWRVWARNYPVWENTLGAALWHRHIGESFAVRARKEGHLSSRLLSNFLVRFLESPNLFLVRALQQGCEFLMVREKYSSIRSHLTMQYWNA